MVAMITMDITKMTTMYDHRNQLNTESGQTIDFTAAQKCPKVSPKKRIYTLMILLLLAAQCNNNKSIIHYLSSLDLSTAVCRGRGWSNVI